ncbi:MAG: glycosyltransferase [bacterium]
MRIVMFYHSLISDWNHGTAHFLRGIATELIRHGHDLRIYEPKDAWSIQNLIASHRYEPIRKFQSAFPHLVSNRYAPDSLDLDQVLDNADLVIVHEWNEPELVERIGSCRARTRNLRLLFHDTHYRMVTDRTSRAAVNLKNYDGVLAFGKVIRDLYLSQGWAQRAWTWHEAADTRIFYPREKANEQDDLVWIGNWGDGERALELYEFLIDPVKDLGLRAVAYGVRYPDHARIALREAGIDYAGWLPDYEVPEMFSKFRATIHVPRRPYGKALPGIPTIRTFEAMACGIPLIVSPWVDIEGLFKPGQDFLVAANGDEMKRLLKNLLHDREMARELTHHAYNTIVSQHTCAHRVQELYAICRDLGIDPGTPLAGLELSRAPGGKEAWER